jgi:hypothetical protein
MEFFEPHLHSEKNRSRRMTVEVNKLTELVIAVARYCIYLQSALSFQARGRTRLPYLWFLDRGDGGPIKFVEGRPSIKMCFVVSIPSLDGRIGRGT